MKIKKLGRPFGTFKENAKRNTICLRLSDEQFELLERLSEEWHMNKIEVIRSLIDYQKVYFN